MNMNYINFSIIRHFWCGFLTVLRQESHHYHLRPSHMANPDHYPSKSYINTSITYSPSAELSLSSQR